MGSWIPKIKPISGEDQPQWSVMIPTYNCAKYLRQTIESVLAQDPGIHNMHIEVVDDFSTHDNPEEVVRDINRQLNQERIIFFRQPKNVGAPRNFNTCIHRSRGKWVHILHGDDFIHPGFYNHLQIGLEKDNVGAAFCSFYFVDEHNQLKHEKEKLMELSGVLPNWTEQIGVKNWIACPTIVIKRSVYETFGGYHEQLIHSADWEMWRRVASNYSVWYEPGVFASYRVHSSSDTSKLVVTGKNIADTRLSINIARQYLGASITKKALRGCCFWGLDTARRFAREKKRKAALYQLKEAFLCHIDFSILKYAVFKVLPRLIFPD